MSSDPLVQYLADRLDKIEDKVDRLLAFKWQVVGGAVVLSGLVTLAFQVAELVFKK